MPARRNNRSALVLIAIAAALGAAGVAVDNWFLIISMVLVIAVQVVSLWMARRRPGGGGRR
jgi:hypothetical protein